MRILLLPFLVGLMFLTIIYLHLVRKNIGAVLAYGLQSGAITLILFSSFWETKSLSLLGIVAVTLVIKVILAPIFFIRFIRKHDLTFSVSTYLNTPLTLIVIAVLTALAHAQKFLPLTNIIPDHRALLALALAAIFISLFLIINRKGALSQALGVLSFENSVVAFALLAGLEQSPMLQIGIIFDIFVWLIIASVFVAMIYKHFGSLDVTAMEHLKE